MTITDTHLYGNGSKDRLVLGGNLDDVAAAFAPLRVEAKPLFQTELTPSGVGYAEVPGRKLITKPLDGDRVLNVVTDWYGIHQYEDALVEPARALVEVADGSVDVGTFGWTNHGGQAFISLRLRNPISLPGGDKVHSEAFIASSHDGSWSTSARLGNYSQFCLNQLPAFHRKSPVVMIRHTSQSQDRLAQMRLVLTALYDEAVTVERIGRRLVATAVTPSQIDAMFELLDARPPEPTEGESTRKVTNWENRRGAFMEYLHTAESLVPYAGTAWGAYQAFNGFNQHVAATKQDRGTRAIVRAVDGDLATADRQTVATIARVLNTDLAALWN